MAVVQATLAEEILNRSERAVVRNIYRAHQLAEAKIMLDKAVSMLGYSERVDGVLTQRPIPELLQTQIRELDAFLRLAIGYALIGIKVPSATTRSKKVSVPPSA